MAQESALPETAPPSLEEALSNQANEPVDGSETTNQQIKLVIFELCREYFAIPGQFISEIIFQADVFFIPGCPESLEGVINVRGEITSVVRLNELLGLPVQPPQGGRSAILLGQGNGMTSGIRVGQVIDVVDINEETIKSSPASLSEDLRLRMPGLLEFAGRPVTVLDIDRLFADYARGLG
jgi:purine-binding chemotaxis protein CheW